MPFPNSSGVVGVIRGDKGRWRAQARYNKQIIELGHYDSVAEATIARIAAERTISKIERMKAPGQI